jgi:hypothetical protein
MSDKELKIDSPSLISHIQSNTDLSDKFKARFENEDDRDFFLDFCFDEIINESKLVHESEACGRMMNHFPFLLMNTRGSISFRLQNLMTEVFS